MDLSRVTWRESSYRTGNVGDCVEVADSLADVVAARDSKDPNGPVLTFTSSDRTAFTSQIRAGDHHP